MLGRLLGELGKDMLRKDKESALDKIKRISKFDWLLKYQALEELLLVACRLMPDIVEDILEILRTLDEADQYAILKLRDREGYDALMILCVKGSNVAMRLLEHIRQRQVEYNYTGTSKHGWNLLMLACEHNVPMAKEIIKQSNTDTKKTILAQTNKDGWNALMIACYYHPELIDPLLASIGTLDKNIQERILTKGGQTNHNAFLIACEHTPAAIPSFLNHIQIFDEATRKRIVKGAFHVVCEYHPDKAQLLLQEYPHLLTEKNHQGISPIFHLLTKNLPLVLNFAKAQKKLFSVLKEKHQGNTPLHQALADNNATAWNHLLASMETLEPEDNRQILAAKDGRGRNVIMHCIENPDMLPALVNRIAASKIPKEQIAELLSIGAIRKVIVQKVQYPRILGLFLENIPKLIPDTTTLTQLFAEDVMGRALQYLYVPWKLVSFIHDFKGMDKEKILKKNFTQIFQSLVIHAFNNNCFEEFSQLELPETLIAKVSYADTMTRIKKKINYESLPAERKRQIMRVEINVHLAALKQVANSELVGLGSNLKANQLYGSIAIAVSNFIASKTYDENLLTNINKAIDDARPILGSTFAGNRLLRCIQSLLSIFFEMDNSLESLEKTVQNYAGFKKSLTLFSGESVIGQSVPSAPDQAIGPST